MLALRGLALLLLVKTLGETISRGLDWPLPGPVVGLLALLPLLTVAPVRACVAPAADALLEHLSLLFVPVGVGVIVHLDAIAPWGAALAVVLVTSTGIGLAATALVLRVLRVGDERDAG